MMNVNFDPEIKVTQFLFFATRCIPQIEGGAQLISDNIWRECITSPTSSKRYEDPGLTEIRPILVRTEEPRIGTTWCGPNACHTWPHNNTHRTTHLTFEVPDISYTTLEVRRITIGGSFFGSETSGYLDAEAEVANELQINKSESTFLPQLITGSSVARVGTSTY